MALHTGQPEAQAGDYLGGPLNRVARLLAIGHGGQILLSGPTADLVADYLPPGVTLRDLGTHRLKDVMRPEHVFQLVAPDLPADFAPVATAGPGSPRGERAPGRSVEQRHRPAPRQAAMVVGAMVLFTAIVVGALAARRMEDGNGHQEPTARVAVGEPTSQSAGGPVPTTTIGETMRAAPATSLPATNATSSTGDGWGQVVYTAVDAQAGVRRLYRVQARAGAEPEDISAALDALPSEGLDSWIVSAPDGAQLAIGTERFAAECAGWQCLAILPGDLASAELVLVTGEVVHPSGPGAIAGPIIIFPSGDGPHDSDLWAIRKQDHSWGAPLLLTGESLYAYHAEPALTADGSRVVFECGDRPYGEAGTALCEVSTDGSGFQATLTPTTAALDVPATAALRHPTYAPDGAVVFQASWDAPIWRMPAGATSAEPVGPGFDSDGAPCVLPDGRIASLWFGRPGNEGLRELKVMASDGGAHDMVVTGADIQQIGCGG